MHCKRLFSCSICKCSFKQKHHLETHVKGHFKQKQLKEEAKLSKSQIRRRAKKEAQKIQNLLRNNSSLAKQTIKMELNRENFDIVDNIQTNPLTEEDIIEIIQDNNLSDRAMLRVIQKLTEKWGKENVITKSIAKKLVKRKKILNNFFTKRWLDNESELHFKTKV